MDLDDLMQQVSGADPLSRLSSAMTVKADLDDLADSLIGHHVDQARRAGHSWSEIGGAMGVTKQAAQQRHSAERPPKRRSSMFTRFSAMAKQSVERATKAAEDLRHGFIGTEHLLLGILDVRESTGAVVLDALGVTRADVEAAVAETASTTLGERASRRRRHTSMTSNARSTLENALREAIDLDERYIGTEHLLLALLRNDEAAAAKLLTGKGITRQRLLDAITQHRAVA